MKKIIYIITASILLTSSCKSIEKMMESGNYDQALRYGVDKLRGEKNKKTKYVKALEKAYVRLNEQDLNEIEHLRLNGKTKSVDRIVDIYHNMENRQNYVMPLLPLISEEGYLAEVKIRNYAKLIQQASIEAAEAHYTLGIKNLENARDSENKRFARRAYSNFIDAESYFEDFKESYTLKNEAYNLGQSRVLLEPYTKGANIAFDHTYDIISQINISELNNTWEKFYLHDNGETLFDYIATIEVTEIRPGRESERISSFTETKRIKDGRTPIKDRSGKIIRDTLGKILYQDKLIDVTAHVTEIYREKIAHMNGRVVIMSTRSNDHVNTIPISITFDFVDYACSFNGDKRAISDQTNKRIKSSCDPFPTDYEITTSLAYNYKSAAEESIQKQYFIN